MDPIRDILFESSLLLVLLLGLIGALLSALLLVSPAAVQRLSDRFNRYVDVDHRIAFLDQDIATNRFIYHHHRIAGALFIVGSLVLLASLFLWVDLERIRHIWQSFRAFSALDEILVTVLMLLGKVAGFAGLLLGMMLACDPVRLQAFESRLAVGVSFQPVVEKLNLFHNDIDDMMLRHPVIFGVCGLLASVLLMLLAGSALRG